MHTETITPARNYAQNLLIVGLLLLSPVAANGAGVTYQYDAKHQLIDTTYDNGASISYSYDPPGNRLSKTSAAKISNLYEDGEDGDTAGWTVLDADPPGASIANVYDDALTNRVVEFNGTGTDNGYHLSNRDGSDWDDTDFKVFEWSMNYAEPFEVIVTVQSQDGLRYLQYTPADSDYLGDSGNIHHGLGSDSNNASWQTFIRDLEFDLKDAQPNNELEAVLGFSIRGSGKVDGIRTLETMPAGLDTDGDTIADVDEINVYGTHPYKIDSDADGIEDGAELNHWGSGWNGDTDNDGFANLIDPDADNDSMVDGTEIAHGFDPGDASSRPGVAELLEVGEVDITDSWAHVELNTSFTHPVVVAKLASFNDSEPCLVRLRNITPSGFDIRLQEYDYQNGVHASETVSYTVLEQGVYSLADGTLIEAGIVTSDDSIFVSRPFARSFNATPIVIASVTSFNDGEAVTDRIQNISLTAFGLKLQEQEGNSDGHAEETVHFIAWEPSSGAINDVNFEVGSTGNTVDENFEQVTFSNSFQDSPVLLNDMQTTNGADTAAVRAYLQDALSFNVKVEEEQSLNDEVGHANETVGYIAFGQIKPFAPEFGEVEINHDWSRVTFGQPINQPVIVTGLNSINDAEPCVIRMTNIDTTGFDIRLQEYDYLDGVHGTETVSYMVIDQGVYALENGKIVEAGIFSSPGTSTITHSFMGGFVELPVLLTSVASINDTEAVTGRVRSISTTSFRYEMEEQEANSDGHLAETIHFVAWETSTGSIAGNAYEAALTTNSITHNLVTVPYATSFQNAPIVLGGMQTTDGGDTAGLRSQNVTNTGFDTKVEEEQSANTETSHTTEQVGYIAVDEQDGASE